MRENKGITLVALVVTIIVLLILAGVSIAMLTDQNGILNQADNAKVTNIEGEVREKVNLAYMAVYTEYVGKITTGQVKASEVTGANLVKSFESNLGTTDYTVTADKQTAAEESGKITITIILGGTAEKTLSQYKQATNNKDASYTHKVVYDGATGTLALGTTQHSFVGVKAQ